MTDSAEDRQRRLGRWLAVLLGLFCLRVVAQPLALVLEPGWLPPFEAWHSGALPYPVLVLCQVVLIALLGRTTAAVLGGRLRPRPRRGRALIAFAAVYAALMIARLALGATALAGSSWWDAPLPSAFHLVLATFAFVAGRACLIER